MKTIRIMVSSTRADLMQYRKEAAGIIAKIKKEVEGKYQIIDGSMEEQVPSGNREFAVGVSKKWVEKADWIVVIVAWHYGTISDEPGADGLSVTEWEYRYAVKLGKKVFVFMPGKRGSAEEYRATEDKEVNLQGWADDQDERQIQQLRRFKKELAGPFIKYFSNLKQFGECLGDTLRQAIHDEPPDIQIYRRLPELILELILVAKLEFKSCLKSVKLLATCKDIHDSLHDLRRDVVSRLQDEILPLWRQQNSLSTTQRNILNRRAMEAERLLGKIEGFAGDLYSNCQNLSYRIDRLVNSNPFWDPEANPGPGFEEFTERVNDFASDVQYSFTEADEAMLRKQEALGNFHSALLKRIGKARGERCLSPKEEMILDGELEETACNKNRLVNALNLHHEWQRFHDNIERLHTQRDTDNFPNRLSYFIRNELPRLTQLVHDKLDTFPAPETLLTDEASRHEQELRDGLQQMRTCVTNLIEHQDGQAFDAMRKSFDEVFYWVDKRTLSEVDRARDRVKGFERLLDDLAMHSKVQFDHPEPGDRP